MYDTNYGPYDIKENRDNILHIFETMVEKSDVLDKKGKKELKKSKELKDLTSGFVSSLRALEILQMTHSNVGAKLHNKLVTNLSKNQSNLSKIKKIINNSVVKSPYFLSKKTILEPKSVGIDYANKLAFDAGYSKKVYMIENKEIMDLYKEGYSLESMFRRTDLFSAISRDASTFNNIKVKKEIELQKYNSYIKGYDSNVLRLIKTADETINIFSKKGNTNELRVQLETIRTKRNELEKLEKEKLKIKYDLEKLSDCHGIGLDSKSINLLLAYEKELNNELQKIENSIKQICDPTFGLSNMISEYKEKLFKHLKDQKEKEENINIELDNMIFSSGDDLKNVSIEEMSNELENQSTLERPKSVISNVISTGEVNNISNSVNDTQNEQNINYEVPYELGDVRSFYYQNYLREQLLNTDLGKKAFSEYLKEVNPKGIELIAIEKKRERIYIDYLKYRVNCQENGLSYEPFSKFVSQQLGQNVNIDKDIIELSYDDKVKYGLVTEEQEDDYGYSASRGGR